MTSCARRNFRALATQRVKVFPESFNIFRGVIIKRLVLFLRFRDDAIVNVRQVHDLGHAIPLEFQITANHIRGDRRTKVPDVSEVPNRRAAVIHPHFALIERTKFFELT